MTKQTAKLTKGIAFFLMAIMWGIASSGEMMKDHKMSGDKEMMKEPDKMMEMESPDAMKSEGHMKPETGNMKAMEAEMKTDKMDEMKMKMKNE